MNNRSIGPVGMAAILLLACDSRATEIAVTSGAPPQCPQAQTLRLTLLDIDMPKAQAANIRIYAIPEKSPEIYVGLASVLAEGNEGSRRTGNLAVTPVASFRKWVAEKAPPEKLQLRLRPFGGASKPLTGLDWKVRAAEWSCR